MRLIVFILLLAAPYCSAAISNFDPPDTTRELYVQTFPDKFYIRPVYTIRNLALQLRELSTRQTIDYKPSGNNFMGLGFYIFGLGFEFSLEIPQSSRNIEEFGRTDGLDLQANVYAKKWHGDIAIQRYDGFYLAQPQQHIPSWTNAQPHPTRSDLEFNNTAINLFYIFNHNRFSYRAHYLHNERQLRSGGSFILGLSYVDQEVLADSSLVPPFTAANSDFEDFQFADFTGIGLLPGYTHSFIYGKLYLNLFLLVGPSYLWATYDEDARFINSRQLSPTFNIRGSIGYNSDKWFAGITYVNQITQFTTDQLNISGASNNFKVFIGYRFKEFGILRKEIL